MFGICITIHYFHLILYQCSPDSITHLLCVYEHDKCLWWSFFVQLTVNYLQTVNYFRNKAPSQIFGRVLNTPPRTYTTTGRHTQQLRITFMNFMKCFKNRCLGSNQWYNIKMYVILNNWGGIIEFLSNLWFWNNLISLFGIRSFTSVPLYFHDNLRGVFATQSNIYDGAFSPK